MNFDIDKSLDIGDHLGHHKKVPQNQLGYYLAGLIEGDGSFGALKLEISYHIKDVASAYALRSSLGFGHIYAYTGTKNAVRYVISNCQGLKHVLDLVNGKFVDHAKIDQLKAHGYDTRFQVTLRPGVKKVTLDNYWLAGFLDADGSLGIFIAPSLTHKHKQSVRLEVKINQKCALNVHLIGHLFNVCKIYQDSTQIYRLNLTGSKRIKALVDYLDVYHLQTLKYTQYVILRRCARYIQAKKHLMHDGLKPIKIWKTRLQNVYK
jgi:LAGLIDADG endonuclease